MARKKSDKGRDTRSGRGRARRRKRIGAVRAVPKPKGRKEVLKWAENLGFEALCKVRGGVQGKLSGASRNHGGSFQITGCCGWDSFFKRRPCTMSAAAKLA
jgi:hypothetical protein